MPLFHYADLPDRLKTWSVVGNAVQASEATGALHAAQAWVTAKNLLLNVVSGLVCSGSSDGATAGLDGVDRITDKTKVVAASGGAAHTWYVFRSAVNGWQVCFDFNAANAWQASVVFSPGGLFTGGSTTARPTATDSRLNRNATDWLIGNATDKLNITAWGTSDGKNFIVAFCSTTRYCAGWMWGALQDPKPYLTLPYYCSVQAVGAVGSAYATPSRYTIDGDTVPDAFTGRGNSNTAVLFQCTSPWTRFGLLFQDPKGYKQSGSGLWTVHGTALHNKTAPDFGRWGVLPDHLFVPGAGTGGGAPVLGDMLCNPDLPSVVAVSLGCWALPWPSDRGFFVVP